MPSINNFWTVPVVVADIPDAGSHHHLDADATMRDALAQRAGLRAVSSLEATFDLDRRGEGVAVRGEVRARVGQTCVVSLEPIENDVVEVVDLVFAPDAEREPRSKKRREQPEPLADGIIDLGAVATEFLILGIDPYPRKDGVTFSQETRDDTGAHPFAALAALKKQP